MILKLSCIASFKYLSLSHYHANNVLNQILSYVYILHNKKQALVHLSWETNNQSENVTNSYIKGALSAKIVNFCYT